MSDELTAHEPVASIASGEHTLTAVEPPRERAATPGLQPGARVGRYHVLGLLGQGGMGEVYRGYDADLDRPVAIKLLRRHATGSNLVLLREAQALAKLSHPNVVAIHDVGATGGSGDSLAQQAQDAQQVFIAMEYIDGVDLAAWLKRPRSLAEILTVFEAAARGLAAAHAAGIVHRDFKPAHVLVARAPTGTGIGRVCVADFGLARALADVGEEATPTPAATLLQTQLTGTGFVVGTPPYLSPEVHVGKSADALADQYAYFVALFEALFGVRPFLGRDLPALLAAKRRGVSQLPSQGPGGVALPPWLRRMVQREARGRATLAARQHGRGRRRARARAHAGTLEPRGRVRRRGHRAGCRRDLPRHAHTGGARSLRPHRQLGRRGLGPGAARSPAQRHRRPGPRHRRDHGAAARAGARRSRAEVAHELSRALRVRAQRRGRSVAAARSPDAVPAAPPVRPSMRSCAR
ncbi:MAG: serine/threonine-protein kinase [Nannocystaceae bacterium]